MGSKYDGAQVLICDNDPLEADAVTRMMPFPPPAVAACRDRELAASITRNRGNGGCGSNEPPSTPVSTLVLPAGASEKDTCVLSRLAVARLLAFFGVDLVVATRVALELKKNLVDANQLIISHRALFQRVLQLLARHDVALIDEHARLMAQYWGTRPLVVVVLKFSPDAAATNTTTCLAVAQRLCDASVLDTHLRLEVDGIVAAEYAAASPGPCVDGDDHARASVARAISAEVSRAWTRGGSLVVGGPADAFAPTPSLVRDLRRALCHKSDLSQSPPLADAVDSVGVASESRRPDTVPCCFLIADVVTVAESTQRCLGAAAAVHSSLAAPMCGFVLETRVERCRGAAAAAVDDELVAQSLISLVRAALGRTL